ncbi:ubiquitin-associated and SH3 domain-containing protein B-like [Branchiostoma floridae]|uniref:Protein UBASH3A homolog n=1 Tax=Branchiostoma floridae TaxID=7739 RepID=A0A9J7MXQ4_BRAFL|nr:ubiquitin-associated and SH3 domain-containing protein B-like [Branchiostoma floridae]
MAEASREFFDRSGLAATIARNVSNLEVLLNMGFPKERAEKALAATGDRSVQLASDWIFAHVDDTSLDEKVPREYVLFACPTGPLVTQLDEYSEKTLVHCGRNGSHNSFPHVTLCSFFAVPDSTVPKVVHAVLTVAGRLSCREVPAKVSLDFYSSSSFVGLFVDDRSAAFLRNASQEFANEVLKTTGIEVKAHKKQLHITLAYQFNPSQQKKLEELARDIDTSMPAQWDLRLYSRDTRRAKSDVVRVVHPLPPSNDDELELVRGDYIYLEPDELVSSSDGWLRGVSWLTGCAGLFPGNYTEKAAETDTWTLHRCVPVISLRGSSSTRASAPPLSPTQLPPLPSEPSTLSSTTRAPVPDRRNGPSRPPLEEMYSQVQKSRPVSNSKPAPPRQLYILRHGERVDVVFGKRWMNACFVNGEYSQQDLNLPRKLPSREGSPLSFAEDSPLTEMGWFQARLTGEAMKRAGVHISQVYSSPSLRCVQTADAILDALGLRSAMKIRVDPGLFEWLYFYKASGLPKLMTMKELLDFGLNVDPTYHPIVPVSDWSRTEDVVQYYQRNHTVVQSVLGSTDGNTLICAHAGSLDSCSRHLQGLSARTQREAVKLMVKIPYCGMAVFQEVKEAGIWDQVEPPIHTLTHSPNHKFDWRVLQS